MPRHRDERGGGYAGGFQQVCHSERHYDNMISRTPLVATGDITGATASQAEDNWVLNFTVTDDAAKRVHEVTKQNVGRNLALVVDGKVYGTPRIAGALTGKGYQIKAINRDDAEKMANEIHKG